MDIPIITIETDTHIIYPDDGKIYNKKSKKFTGTKDSGGYLRFKLNNKSTLNHRYIYEIVNGPIPEGMEVNHINFKTDDNRISNLDLMTHQQNSQYQQNVKGYYWSKDNQKWEAYINLNNKRIYLGRFDNENDARNAYVSKAKEFNELGHRYNV